MINKILNKLLNSPTNKEKMLGFIFNEFINSSYIKDSE